MKIKPEHFEHLKKAIQPFDTPERRARYIAGDFPNADRVKNLDMRYRWDVFYASRLKLGDGVGVQGDLNLYAYMNDEHIDTALRQIVPPLRP